MMEEILQQHVLNVVQKMEDRVDDQIHAMDKLQEDDFDSLRQKRLKDMKRQQVKRQIWLSRGHGEYREIDTETAFFEEMKGEERMVCHFYRDTWPCQVMDKHLAILAKSHIETKFVKINAEKSPFLTDRLKIWMLPTLALIRDEKTEDYIVGFNELGGKDHFETTVLEARLQVAGLLNVNEQPAPKAAPRAVRKGGASAAAARGSDDESSDFSE